MRALGLLLAVGLSTSAMAQNPGVITDPDWARRPNGGDIVAVWPAEAFRRGIGGSATISCTVSVVGMLETCAVVHEAPANSGFGASALMLAPSFQMKPKTVAGVPVAGGTVRIPIVFRSEYGATDSGSTVKVIAQPYLSAAPTRAELAAAWPNFGTANLETAQASVRCQVRADATLTNCEFVSVSPSGKGFESAARDMSRKFKVVIDGMSRESRENMRVLLPIHFANPNKPAPPPRADRPQWTSLPDPAVVQAVYPQAAFEKGVLAGMGTTQCIVDQSGSLTGCTVVAESPSGLGFGNAALKVVAVMRMSPWNADGTPVEGATLRVPIKFSYAPP